MLKNAYEMHGSIAATANEQIDGQGSGDAVFQNYTLKGESYVSAGSLVWCWRSIVSGELAEMEGIWLPSRLIIFQVAQIIIGVFSCSVGFWIIEAVADEADDARAELERTVRRYPDWVFDLVPTGK